MGSRVYHFFKKYLVKLILVVAICITSYFFSNVYVKSVDFFVRDFLQYFNTPLNSVISKDITIVDIDSNTDGFSSPLRYSELEKLILALKKYEPKAVLLNIEPMEFTEDLSERKKLRQLLEKNSIWLSDTKSRYGKIGFYEDPVFTDFNQHYPSSFAIDESSGYYSPRRMLLKLHGDSHNKTLFDSLPQIGIDILPAYSFKYAFDRMNTLQLFNKFYKAIKFNTLNAEKIITEKHELALMKNKIIIIGRVDEFSFMAAENPLNLLGKPQATSNLDDSVIPLHHLLANQLNTLLTGDYVKYKNGTKLHIILSFILILLVLLKLEPQIKLYIFLLMLPVTVVFQVLLYSLSSFYIDIVPTYLMLISAQYLVIPLISLAMFKQKERQKLQDISNARIDALLAVSEKVAHDIRSPLGAINLILSRTKFENLEHKEIVYGALKRIDETAESILAKYKVKDNKQNPFDNINVFKIISKIISEKQVLDSKIEFILHAENENLYASAYSIELESVISNIFDNSIFAVKNKDSKIIKTSIATSNNTIVICIHDNGIGIPSSVLKLLGHEKVTTKAGKMGNGIGLLHAKRTIERMQGVFEITSVENQYTQVEIRLKIA